MFSLKGSMISIVEGNIKNCVKIGFVQVKYVPFSLVKVISDMINCKWNIKAGFNGTKKSLMHILENQGSLGFRVKSVI